MSVNLGQIITAVRGLHPAFDRTRVPDTVLASALSDYQNELIGIAVLRDKTFASQSIAIALAAGVDLTTDLLVDLSISGVPFTSSTQGFLVKVNGNGTPYIDSESPLTVTVDQGVNLPIVLACIGGTVRYTDGQCPEDLCITSYGRRYDPPRFPAVYFVDQTLMLCGTLQDWAGITSIELRVTPFAPALTALESYFLVPDGARPCLVAYAANVAAERALAYGQATKQPLPLIEGFVARAKRAEDRYLSTLRITKRARVTTMREESY